MSSRRCNRHPTVCGVKGAVYVWDDVAWTWQRLTRSTILTDDPDAFDPDAPVAYGWRGTPPTGGPWGLEDAGPGSGAGLTTTWRDAYASLRPPRPAPVRAVPDGPVSTPVTAPLTATAHITGNPLAAAWTDELAAIRVVNDARTVDGPRVAPDAHHDAHVRVSRARTAACRRYAWAIPTDEALATIAACGPVVELGAGTGYWAALLAAAGVDVLAYDAAPPQAAANPFHADAPRYHPIAPGGPEVLAAHADRALLLCWPPYDEPVAHAALCAYAGDTVIYVGEGPGGCTGDARFHHRLARLYERTATVALPTWPGIHDQLTVHRRRGR